MLLRAIAKRFPTSRIGKNCDEICKLEFLEKCFYYGIIGSFAGAAYGACTNKIRKETWKVVWKERLEALCAERSQELFIP
jgi:hypothetical protein